MTSLESNYLVPNGTFIVELVVFTLVVLPLLVLLVAVPLIRSVSKDRWGWAVACLVFPLVGGALYLATADRSVNSSATGPC